MDPRAVGAAGRATTGDVFYRLGGNDVIDQQLGGEPLLVPQRDVLHIRLHTTQQRYPVSADRRVADRGGDADIVRRQRDRRSSRSSST